MFKVYLEKKNIPKDSKKLLNLSIQSVLLESLVDWREKTLPGHFKFWAARAYKHHNRSIKYNKKKKKKGNLPDMVYTGRARDKMLADKRQPTGTAQKMVLRLRNVGFFHYRYKGWPHAMRDEVTRLTDNEMKKIYEQIKIRLAQRLANERSHERYLLR